MPTSENTSDRLRPISLWACHQFVTLSVQSSESRLGLPSESRLGLIFGIPESAQPSGIQKLLLLVFLSYSVLFHYSYSSATILFPYIYYVLLPAMIYIVSSRHSVAFIPKINFGQKNITSVLAWKLIPCTTFSEIWDQTQNKGTAHKLRPQVPRNPSISEGSSIRSTP